MQLQCKACNKPIPAQDVNLDLGIARCLACNEVFSFLDTVGGVVSPRPTVAQPKRFKVENWGSELVITRRWFTHAVWALLGFCIFWDGFLVVWYTIGVRMLLHGQETNGGIWAMLLFPVLHVAVGLGLTYGVLCMLLNKTVIRVTSGELSVTHGPLPCTGNCLTPTADIKQLFCTMKKVRGEDRWHTTYNLIALQWDDSQVTLLSGLEVLDHAVFVEQQVEEHLKIRDERAPGEVRYEPSSAEGVARKDSTSGSHWLGGFQAGSLGGRMQQAS